MISVDQQAQYDAYWKAYQQIRQSGLRIDSHPVVAPVLAQARTIYVSLQQNQQASFTFAGFLEVWRNAAKYVAYLVAETLRNLPDGIDSTKLINAIRALNTAVGNDLIGQPPMPAPHLLPGMNAYMNIND